jgi:outer membrane protein OmpA-like peptidoglycan-associated protein
MKISQSIGKLFWILMLLNISLLQLCFSQDNRKDQPEWWFGGALGPNFNFYSSDIRPFGPSVPTSVPSFSKGSGIGVFLSPLLEYRHDPIWGGLLFLGFDGRGGGFDDVQRNGGTYKLKTAENYITFEPNVRVTPFSVPLYFFAGPRIGFNVAKSFTYSSPGSADSSGDWNGTRGSVFGVQFGAGYDIPLTDANASSQIALSPFFALHVGQGPNSDQNWSLTTFRFGVGIKFGSGGEGKHNAESEAQFSVTAPKIIPTERKVKETFPMRNYVFFDEGSATVPQRYVQLTKEQAANFKEEQLLQPDPNDVGGRSRRQLTVYHNILNILGDRLRRYPSAAIHLIGSSDQGATQGKDCAESVKRYLVEVFGIDGNRITTKGREKPEVPSTLPGASRELELVRPEDHRVEVTSSSDEMLEPVQIISLQEEPLDSDVLFSVPGAGQNLSSWSVEVTDEAGTVKRYGPFTADQERVSGKTILGDQTEGRYKVIMLGETKSGQSVRKEETIRLVKSNEPEAAPGLRFSILFEFDQSKTVATYDRFLSQTVAPLIPAGGSVVIHGHTDIIGEESHNLKLSRDRAQETMTVLQRELTRMGKKNVKFDTYGFGEDVRRAPFDNRLPEERFYNRTVIIDIVQE